jgi:hypothetical protein
MSPGAGEARLPLSDIDRRPTKRTRARSVRRWSKTHRLEGHRDSDHAYDLPVHESVPIRTTHGRENCKIQATDPTVSIKWSELERGHWRAVCVCGIEDYREPVADRVRLDPLDAKTSRRAGQCEFASATDAAVLRVLLRVKDGMGGDYWWVECGACDTRLAGSYYAGEGVR